MVRKMFFAVVMTFMALSVQSQNDDREPVRDPNNKYLVWTANIKKGDQEKNSVADSASVDKEEQQVQSFMGRYFAYRSMCDWVPGMRFMVLPDTKDMVIRTFTDSVTDMMVSSLSLRYKIMVYNGYTRGELHDRVWFKEEESKKAYYYELPTKSFEDYCYTKYGVPTLAYLDDVDNAMEQLVGKELVTVNTHYNVDVSTTSSGYDKVAVHKGTPVTVKAVGVGTRNFPVKLIVEDRSGNQFFQNVAISRTNSGLSDDEFEEQENKIHTFEGAFRMEEGAAVETEAREYDHYIGRTVITLRNTVMLNGYNIEETIPRLTELRIMSIKSLAGTDYVTVTLQKDDQTYKKMVTFSRHADMEEGIAVDKREDYFEYLFHVGTLDMVGVNKANMSYIRDGLVKPGFTEEEVILALGEPDAHGHSSRGTSYTWIYKSMLNKTQCVVFFNNTTKLVTSIRQQ